MYISSSTWAIDNKFLYKQHVYYSYPHFFIIFTIDKSLAKWFTLWIQVAGDPGSLQFTDKSFTHTDLLLLFLMILLEVYFKIEQEKVTDEA